MKVVQEQQLAAFVGKPAGLLFSTGGAAIKGTGLTGWQTAGFRSLVAAVVMWLVLRHAPDFRAETVEMRVSSSGNYLSVTCVVRATSKAQLDALYREITSHPWVKMAL